MLSQLPCLALALRHLHLAISRCLLPHVSFELLVVLVRKQPVVLASEILLDLRENESCSRHVKLLQAS